MAKQRKKKRKLVKAEDYDGWSWELENGQLWGFAADKAWLECTCRIAGPAIAVRVKLAKVMTP